MVRWPAWWRARPARWTRRIVGFALLGLLGALLLLAALVALPAGRVLVLETALGQAHRVLPGELTLAGASWPAPGRLELEGLLWRVAPGGSLPDHTPGDTLAFVPRLVVDVSLDALRDHELDVTEILLDAGPVDVPAILAVLSSPSAESPAAEPESDPGEPFLAPGSVPGIPGLHLERLELAARRVVLPDGHHLGSAGLRGRLELRQGILPRLELHEGQARLRLATPEGDFHLHVDSLELDLEGNPAEQVFRLRRLAVRLPEAGTDTLRAAWRQAGAVQLDWAGQGAWTDRGLSIELSGASVLPGPDHVRPWLPETFPADIQGPLRGSIALQAAVPDLNSPDPRGSVRLDFSPTAWLDEMILHAGYEASRVQVDSLVLDLLGARLDLTARVDSLAVEGDLRASLKEPTLLRMFGGEALATADAGLDLRARVKGAWPIPAVDCDLSAHLESSDLRVPDLQARIQGDGDALQARLRLPAGLQAGGTVVDSLQLGLRGEYARRDSLTYGFELGVWSPQGRVLAGGAGEVDTVRTLRLDSLVVTALDSTMRTSRPALLTLGPGPRDWRLEDLHLAGTLGTIDLAGGQVDQGLKLNLDTDLLLDHVFLQTRAPAPIWLQNGGTDLALQGRVDLDVDDTGPRFAGEALVHLRPRREAPVLGAALDFQLAREPQPGLGAQLALMADEVSLLRGTFLWPGRADLETRTWVPDPERGLSLVFPDQQVDLVLLQPYLPPDIGVAGTLDLGLELQQGARGPETASETGTVLTGATVAGYLKTSGLQAELPHRSRIALEVDTRLSGALQDPRLEGEVVVSSGFFRMPELPPVLLPKQGRSLLWEALATADSLALVAEGKEPADPPQARKKKGAPFLPDMDLAIRVPGNLVLNGLGLNAEVEGDLRIQRGEDRHGAPALLISGEVGLVDGTFKFMNHVFRPERTVISFNRAAPPNPILDLLLAADVSGYRVLLEVTGFADKPEVALRSEPALDESDIVSVLLFGQTVNDLDNDQLGRVGQEKTAGAQLKQNLAAMAVVFGGAGVQSQVTDALSVDMVDLGQDSSGGSTLMVGKFLTPRILMKYNKSLEKSGTFFMTVEYTLSRYFRLLSTYGQGEEGSGLELKWTRRS